MHFIIILTIVIFILFYKSEKPHDGTVVCILSSFSAFLSAFVIFMLSVVLHQNSNLYEKKAVETILLEKIDKDYYAVRLFEENNKIWVFKEKDSPQGVTFKKDDNLINKKIDSSEAKLVIYKYCMKEKAKNFLFDLNDEQYMEFYAPKNSTNYIEK